MVSSKDVASLAGVSQATVSRVLNNPENVRSDTRNKVIHAIERLDYHPNLIARSLVTQRTQTIALLSGSLRNGFYVETTDVVVNLATRHGYKTMVYFETENMRNIFMSAVGNQVDGILLSTIKLIDPLFEEIKRINIPYMFFNRRPREGGNYVVMDNLLAGEVMTRYLLDIGHRRIAYISGGLEVSTFAERLIGFHKAFKAMGVLVQPHLIHICDTSEMEVKKIIWEFMNCAEPPTAIIASTDAIALSCLEQLLVMGRKVPEDVSLVGIDNISISSHRSIQLTTIGSNNEDLGETAVENLIMLIERGPVLGNPIQKVLVPKLVLRKTSSPLR